jgi:biopolymer transport protein ExbB
MCKQSTRRWRCVLSFAVIAVLMAGILHTATLLDAQRASAQDAKAGGEPAKAGAAADEEAAAKPRESLLVYYYKALKPLYTIVFLTLSFVFVALMVMNMLQIRRDTIVPLHLIEAFEGYLNEKKYQDAYELAKGDESFLGKVLAAGLAKLSAGYEKAIEGMQEVGEEENLALEQRLSYLALIGTVAPMVGLLGTVDGMIGAFQTIEHSPTSPKPSQLAGSISMALVTTLFGLYIAIPALAVYLYFKNRAARLVLEVGVVSEGLMSRFESHGKKTTPA